MLLVSKAVGLLLFNICLTFFFTISNSHNLTKTFFFIISNSHNLTNADQQEIDEIIMRDINRTFPEHPFFGSTRGQTSLFRLLKAYSLQDIEAGYCQVCIFVSVSVSSLLCGSCLLLAFMTFPIILTAHAIVLLSAPHSSFFLLFLTGHGLCCGRPADVFARGACVQVSSIAQI